ncbi:MAG: RNA polymerase factor sigma-32 [Acidobacteria bacterium]|nr:RNA polymerase factor sigma-32 [Acidobacteriota bacterium]MBI3655122.1 RNA polymerase factor sigma-32 [Acidobacteriota bacterium]
MAEFSNINHPSAETEIEVPTEPPIPSISHERGLVSIDPLQRYIMDIRKYPMVRAEEQRELAIRYQQQDDLEAAKRLATSTLRLVIKIAMEYRRVYMNLLDLIQEGNIGLLHAIKKFDPYKGTKFSSYAAWWIRAYMLKYILDNWSLVKFGTSNDKRKLFFNLKREKEKLESDADKPKLLADKFGVSEKDILDAEAVISSRDLSLDATTSEWSDRSHADMLPAPGKAVDDRIADEEYQDLVKVKLQEFSRRLSEKELIIFNERLLTEEPVTLQEIGDRYGISRERVRQIEARIKKNLKAFLRQDPRFHEDRLIHK